MSLRAWYSRLVAVDVGGVHDEVVVAAFDLQHRLVLAHVELVVLGDLAVILQRFLAGGLLVGAGEGNVADLQQLGRGEEGHVAGIVEQRIHQAALVDVDDGEAGALGVDAASQAGGASADDDDVEGEDVRGFASMSKDNVFRTGRRCGQGPGGIMRGDLTPAP